MMNPEISIQFFYHIIKNGSVILSNLPKELLPEVDTCLAESKLLSCKVRGVLKRQKKLPIEDGFVYLCTYDTSVTKNDFKDGNLKYSLYNSENRKISTGSIPSSGNVLIAKNDYLKNNFTNNYTILIWLQNTDDNQEYEEDSTFVGGFDITANQVKYK